MRFTKSTDGMSFFKKFMKASAVALRKYDFVSSEYSLVHCISADLNSRRKLAHSNVNVENGHYSLL